MALNLKRTSVVAQVADAIRNEILVGAWKEWVPSERRLSETLHVSRNTCRSALSMLYREMLIEPVRGRGIRVKHTAIPRVPQLEVHTRSVGVIIPEGIGRLRPSIAWMLEELQAELFDLGVRLNLHHSSAYYRANPQHAIENLIQKNPHDCWILVLSHRPLQKLFMDKGLPCVVSGSLYPDIRLPSVDYDYRAICRHAVGKLLSLGHRRIIFMNRRVRGAGDLESEAGFLEGSVDSRHTDVDARVVYHGDDRASVLNLTNGLFASASPPTALIVANSYCYLSVVSALARLNLQVPSDVSVIARDDDPFFEYVAPDPARYTINVSGVARRLMSIVRSLLEGRSAKFEPMRVVPRFFPGGSVKKL
jgi:LacI family transcriptional regulator